MMKRDNAERRRKTMRGCGGWASGGSVLRYHLTVVVLVLTLWSTTVSSIDQTKLLQHRTLKRTGESLITRFSTALLKSPVNYYVNPLRYLYVTADVNALTSTCRIRLNSFN